MVFSVLDLFSETKVLIRFEFYKSIMVQWLQKFSVILSRLFICLLFLFFHKFRKNSLHFSLNRSNNNNPELRVFKLPHFGHFTETDAAVQFNSMSIPMNSCPQSLHLYLYIPLSIVRYDLCVINVIYIGMARTPYLFQSHFTISCANVSIFSHHTPQRYMWFRS